MLRDLLLLDTPPHCLARIQPSHHEEYHEASGFSPVSNVRSNTLYNSIVRNFTGAFFSVQGTLRNAFWQYQIDLMFLYLADLFRGIFQGLNSNHIMFIHINLYI